VFLLSVRLLRGEGVEEGVYAGVLGVFLSAFLALALVLALGVEGFPGVVVATVAVLGLGLG
jgi:hypothetical protein